MSAADTMPSLDDFSMESEETVPINYSTFSGLKNGMDKPTPKSGLMSPAGKEKSRVNKSPDRNRPVSKSWLTSREV